MKGHPREPNSRADNRHHRISAIKNSFDFDRKLLWALLPPRHPNSHYVAGNGNEEFVEHMTTQLFQRLDRPICSFVAGGFRSVPKYVYDGKPQMSSSGRFFLTSEVRRFLRQFATHLATELGNKPISRIARRGELGLAVIVYECIRRSVLVNYFVIHE